MKILDGKISYSDLLMLPIPKIDRLLEAQTAISKEETDDAPQANS